MMALVPSSLFYCRHRPPQNDKRFPPMGQPRRCFSGWYAGYTSSKMQQGHSVRRQLERRFTTVEISLEMEVHFKASA